MALEKILSEKDLKRIPVDLLKTINESIESEINQRSSKLESDMINKFEQLSKGLEERFDNFVQGAITESVNSNLHEKVNKKMHGILGKIASALESSGIPVTEKTIELEKKLKEVSNKLVDTFNERESLKDEINGTKRDKYIIGKLNGMRPEVVSAALEHFKDKDILEVESEIEDFINGNLKDIVPDTSDDLDSLVNLDLDRVSDALNEIEDNAAKNKKESIRFENAIFDKLGKGLKKTKIPNNKTNIPINNDVLDSSSDIVMESLGDDDATKYINNTDNDANEALDRMNDFNSLGFGFEYKKNKKQ